MSNYSALLPPSSAFGKLMKNITYETGQLVLVKGRNGQDELGVIATKNVKANYVPRDFYYVYMIRSKQISVIPFDTIIKPLSPLSKKHFV